MYIGKIGFALVLCAGLAACGDSVGEQALVGAGAGVLGSAVLDSDPFVGAAAGAAANVFYCQYRNTCN